MTTFRRLAFAGLAGIAAKVFADPELPGVRDGKITVWHCGRKHSDFDLNYLGTGENYHNPPLGPGFYFISNRQWALQYCKYVADPHLYEVELEVKYLFHTPSGKPLRLRNAFNRSMERYGLDWKSTERLRLKDPVKWRRMHLESGIGGLWVVLGDRASIEVAVFHPDLINIVSVTRMKHVRGENEYGPWYQATPYD